jgi:FKBP-type peptidyl-prolyl cis-trans isomerase (trigger factor)
VRLQVTQESLEGCGVKLIVHVPAKVCKACYARALDNMRK